jgi:hypothetical protein
MGRKINPIIKPCNFIVDDSLIVAVMEINSII